MAWHVLLAPWHQHGASVDPAHVTQLTGADTANLSHLAPRPRPQRAPHPSHITESSGRGRDGFMFHCSVYPLGAYISAVGRKGRQARVNELTNKDLKC